MSEKKNGHRTHRKAQKRKLPDKNEIVILITLQRWKYFDVNYAPESFKRLEEKGLINSDMALTAPGKKLAIKYILELDYYIKLMDEINNYVSGKKRGES